MPKTTRMKPRQIRFSDEVWEWANVEASHRGQTVSEFIREATVARCAYAELVREGPDVANWQTLYDAAADYLRQRG